jgi:hypothetical protein
MTLVTASTRNWHKLGDRSIDTLETLRFDPADFAAVCAAPNDPGYAYGQSWVSGAARWKPGDLTYQLAREMGDSGTQIFNERTAWGAHWLNAYNDGGDNYTWVFDQCEPVGLVVKEAKGRGRLYLLVVGPDGYLNPIKTDTVYDGFGETSFLARWGWTLPFIAAAAAYAATTYFAPAAVGEVIPGALTTVGGEVIAPGAGTIATAVQTATAGTVSASTVAAGTFIQTLAKSAVDLATSVFTGFDLSKFVGDLSKLYAFYTVQKNSGQKVTLPKPGTTVLPDGSVMTVNPDGSTTIRRPDGSVTTIDLAGNILPGQSWAGSGGQWIAGLDNTTVMLAAGGVAIALFALRR